jgi:alginate O-acetyltransferase complex protein AlgI
MLFNSYVFLFLFLPIVLLAWWVPRNLQLRLALLVLASYVFYAGWDYRFCSLMLLTTVMDYVAAGRIARSGTPRERKGWLVAALVFNLGLLAYFKYAGFFARSVNDVAHAMGLGAIAPTLSIVLPLGISFYTFESMSYTIDVYRRIARPAKSFLHYMLFISIFPKLIAGPIIRYTDVEDQYANLRERVDPVLMWRGVVFFAIGMVKKVLIADQIAAHAAPLMGAVHPGIAESWAIVGSYTLQIYFDFSGYSDMAVGLGYMLGFRFPQNFNRPYIARNISEFWDRWHITFSRWLRDYLFIPLGGSRAGALRTLRNLFIVMFLGGLWHGANWTFVAWGAYHGTLLGIYHSSRMLRKRGVLRVPEMPDRVALVVTLLAVIFGWALFLSPNFAAAWALVSGMVGAHGLGDASTLRVLHHPIAIVAVAWLAIVPEVWDWELVPRRRVAVGAAAVLVLCIMMLGGYSPFIYYQF